MCTSTDVSTVGKHNACVVILHGGVVVSMQGNEGRITPTLKKCGSGLVSESDTICSEQKSKKYRIYDNVQEIVRCQWRNSADART